jgi:hypothetical protein
MEGRLLHGNGLRRESNCKTGKWRNADGANFKGIIVTEARMSQLYKVGKANDKTMSAMILNSKLLNAEK